MSSVLLLLLFLKLFITLRHETITYNLGRETIAILEAEIACRINHEVSSKTRNLCVSFDRN